MTYRSFALPTFIYTITSTLLCQYIFQVPLAIHCSKHFYSAVIIVPHQRIVVNQPYEQHYLFYKVKANASRQLAFAYHLILYVAYAEKGERLEWRNYL